MTLTAVVGSEYLCPLAKNNGLASKSLSPIFFVLVDYHPHPRLALVRVVQLIGIGIPESLPIFAFESAVRFENGAGSLDYFTHHVSHQARLRIFI
jgi:hypothetical protein